MDGSRPIRLGIVGLGLIAQSAHLPNLRAMPDRFEIVGVCDLSRDLAERVAAGIEPHPRVAADPQALFADPSIDAVQLCTAGAHDRLARAALSEGKHVFAEKPYSYDPVRAERDAMDARNRGLVLQVGYMKMYEPAIARARAAMEKIGRIRLVRISVLHPSDEHQTSHLKLLRPREDVTEKLAEVRAAGAAEVRAALDANCPEADPVLFRNVLHGSVCHEFS
ncbi:MAG: Gfo/Idh/MocA family oxidoreductase, partial [Bifidobacteriaceae bacterium]|nr:Gfo/Idh/MocA family oxidoreductase [Bifidobacteriaceae bacterium]